jgi:hypothetical protein
MNLQKILVPVFGVVLVVGGYSAYGWAGIALVAGAIVMWVLLHFNRITSVLGRAAQNPVGSVGSAVMLNVKLKPHFNLLRVVAMTQSLGERLSAEEADPEIFRWTDGGGSSVTAEFLHGKLVKWELVRPPESDEAATESAQQVPAGN